MTGDFLAEPEAIPTAVDAVRAVRGRLASWFVLGSNDYFEPQMLNYFSYFRKRRARRRARRGRAPELIDALLVDGWVDLTNVRRSISLDGLDVELLDSTTRTSAVTTFGSRPAEPRIASASP